MLDSKTTLGFRENVASEIVSTPLLNSVSTSSISDFSFPAQGDTPGESFSNHNHEIFCLLQNLPMDNSTLEQIYISVDTLIDKNVKNQSVSGIDFNVSINSRNISTKGISSAGVTITDEGRLKGTFCAETLFNFSHKVFKETETKVLEQGLNFAPTQKCINELELRKDFVEFCRKMRIKRHFRNEITEDFSTNPVFRPKSNWTPPLGHPNLEMFLNELEKELFENSNFSHFHQQNFSREEWKALRNFAEDKGIVIRSADKGSCVIIWDREDCLNEADRQLSDNKIHRDVKCTKYMLSSLVDKSNMIFQSLSKKKYISEKELKYFTYNNKNTTNFGKLFFYLRSTSGYLNFQGDQSNQTVEILLKKF